MLMVSFFMQNRQKSIKIMARNPDYRTAAVLNYSYTTKGGVYFDFQKNIL